MGRTKKTILYALVFALQMGCSTAQKHSRRHGWLDQASHPVNSPLSSKEYRDIKKDASRWQWPLKTAFVTSPFGDRDGNRHDGVDLKAPIKTKVFAASQGKVVYSDSKVRGYGKMIVIEHEKDLFTIYAHHSKNLVKKGDYVKRGQVIALSGKTGHARGPHLHFEVRRGTIPIDPVLILPNEPSHKASSDRLASAAH